MTFQRVKKWVYGRGRSISRHHDRAVEMCLVANALFSADDKYLARHLHNDPYGFRYMLPVD